MSLHTNGQRYWRVFYTAPRAEKKCEMVLEEQHIEVFLPKRIVTRQWKDRKKKIVEPLFQNYIFAHVDERERIRVLQTQGIVRCLTFSGRPAELLPEELNQIRLLQQEMERLEPISMPRPQKGAEVEIEAGPLSGLKGEVVELRGGAYLVVRVPTLNQAIKVSIPDAWVTQVKG